MKKVKLILVGLLFISISYYSEALTPFSKAKKEVKVKRHHNNGHHGWHRGGHHGKPVGAPLDGGLLTILGAAGIGYYLIRKKKKAIHE